MENVSENTVENTNTSNEIQEDVMDEGQMIENEMETVGNESKDNGAAEVVAEPTSADGEKKAAPAYQVFMTALQAHVEALGLSIKEQKGFIQFMNQTTGHKLYLAKGGREVKRVDTTLPKDQLEGLWLPLENDNGRITCHIEPTVDAVALALEVLAKFDGKIPAPKRSKKADKAESSATETTASAQQ